MRREIPDDLKSAVAILMNDLEWLKDSQMEQNKALASIQTEQGLFKNGCRDRHESLERDRHARWDQVHAELAGLSSFKKIILAIVAVMLTVTSLMGIPSLIKWFHQDGGKAQIQTITPRSPIMAPMDGGVAKKAKDNPS